MNVGGVRDDDDDDDDVHQNGVVFVYNGRIVLFIYFVVAPTSLDLNWRQYLIRKMVTHFSDAHLMVGAIFIC